MAWDNTQMLINEQKEKKEASGWLRLAQKLKGKLETKQIPDATNWV